MFKKLLSLFSKKPDANIDAGNYFNSFVLPKIKKGDLCIDCGAHIGQEALLMAQKGAIVHSFEPNPFPLKIMQDEIKRLNLSSLITTYQKAVSVENKVQKLFLRRDENINPVDLAQSSSLISAKKNINLDESLDVECIDLTEFIEQFGSSQIKLLKLDVEGEEYEIMNKIFDKNLYEKIEIIIVEEHWNKIPGYEEKHTQLTEKIKALNIKNIYCFTSLG